MTIKYIYAIDKRIGYSVRLRKAGLTQCQSYDYDGNPVMMPTIQRLRWAMLWQVKRAEDIK